MREHFEHAIGADAKEERKTRNATWFYQQRATKVDIRHIPARRAERQ